MKRARTIAAIGIIAVSACAMTSCGKTLRDTFYGSRTSGIAPIGDEPASAALFSDTPRSDRRDSLR